jgi:hypothetical protein
MADINEPILIAAHEHSMNNRQLLVAGGLCGCFYCLHTFGAEEVSEWIDDGRTALCPRCHVDAVLSSQVDPVDPTFLKRMHARWFERSDKLDLSQEIAKLQPSPDVEP